ncbi:MAG: hypothetical protein ACJZ15_03800 [Candidatus Neomarinimicrobiota bacterium]|tara:strand:+ start:245 stop:385 length:141 start_codon:yes stop_codon:yes gene_type:complete
MKKYITLFALAVSVVGLAITIDRKDWFMVFVIITSLLQILISRGWK